MIYALTDLNESSTLLETGDYEFKKLIIESLSAFVDGYKFTPSYRAGIWDGKKHFATITDNGDIMFPKGLISYVLKKLKEQEKEYTYQRITYEHIKEPSKADFDAWVATLGLPFTPYDYQTQSAYDAIRHKRLVVLAATGAGKSLILALMMQYQFKEKRKTLLIVPNVLLLQQMKQDMIDYFGENAFTNSIVTIGGDTRLTAIEKEEVFADGDSIIFSTWQSLITNPSLLKDVECVMVDECLAGDTNISMADGSTKQIMDVIPGDIVKTINEETKEVEDKEVVKLHINIPSEDMYEIELDSGSIQITGNHKVNTLDGWKRVDELSINDEIISLGTV